MSRTTRIVVKTALLCVAGVLFISGARALAWWSRGHENIVDGAVAALPGEMPEFFRNGAASLRLSSTDPDWWANKALPELRAAEAPNHFIDLEVLKGRELPRTREAYLGLCKELGVDAAKAGFVPYAAEEWQERLVLAFAEYRKHPEDRNVQGKVLYVAGVLSHYLADATQPLHTTVDFDGRTSPDGSSPRSGIHNKVDALLETRPPVPTDIKIEASKDMFATVLEAIMEAHGKVERVYELENKLPSPPDVDWGNFDDQVKQLARERFRAAIKVTATAWYTAWVQSKEIEVPEWR